MGACGRGREMGGLMDLCMYMQRVCMCVCRERVMRRYGKHACKSERDRVHVGLGPCVS